MSLSLEELVIGCYTSSTFNAKWSDNNTEQSGRFVEYTKSKHCYENLKFLIEIVRYENLWNMCFATRHVSVLKCRRCDTHQMHQLKQRTASCTECTNTECTSAEENTSDTTLTDLREYELGQQWREIMTQYIYEDSPNQINLPNELYEEIIEADKDENVEYHSPEILLKAQKYTLELLRENAYYGFTIEEDRQKCTYLIQGPCGIRGTVKDYEPQPPLIAPVEPKKTFSLKNKLNRFKTNTLLRARSKT